MIVNLIWNDDKAANLAVHSSGLKCPTGSLKTKFYFRKFQLMIKSTLIQIWKINVLQFFLRTAIEVELLKLLFDMIIA